MSPANEPDADVREAAWKSLSNLFDQLDPFVLQGYARNFQNEPARQLTVYLALNKKYVEQNLADDMAFAQEAIGSLYMHPQIDKPDKAVPYYTAALNYWDAKQGAKRAGIEGKLMEAYLRSKQLKEGMELARGRIQRDRSAAETMGRTILEEADRLERAKDLKSASELLTEAKTLQIGGSIGTAIEERDKEVRARIVPFNDSLADFWRIVVA
jgi:hypothetical protein